MSIAEEIDDFFTESGQEVFIEVEGKPSDIDQFILNYNSQYGYNLDRHEDGVIVLKENANKWGIELRMYFSDETGIPSNVSVTKNRVYRSEYYYRINDVELIRQMFSLGYKIGRN